MRAGHLLVLLSGCGFHLQGAPGDGPATADAAFDAAVDADFDAAVDGATVDAAFDAAMVDAPIDGPSVMTCTVGPTGTPQAITAIGGTGGVQQGTLMCPTGELPIGVQFDVTPIEIPAHGPQTLMVHVRARCARVTRTTSNTMTSASAGLVSHLGLMGSSPNACDAYVPPTATGEVVCPPGQVLTGLRGNQVDTTLYNTVAIRCSTLTTQGAVTASTTVMTVAGTGAYSNAIETANCPAGTAIISMFARSGCGQDSLTPSCAPLSCQ